MSVSEETVLVLIDYQERLFRAMHQKERLLENAVKLVRGSLVLDVPIIRTEQNPNGLGPTLPELSALIEDQPAVTKMSFSCCKEPGFMEQLEKHQYETVLLAGIESHVCVYQTAVDLVDLGYEVMVAADAVSSRTQENARIGLDMCHNTGAWITSVEAFLFECLGTAEDERFRDLVKIVK